MTCLCETAGFLPAAAEAAARSASDNLAAAAALSRPSVGSHEVGKSAPRTLLPADVAPTICAVPSARVTITDVA